jgi:hypothetical protein
VEQFFRLIDRKNDRRVGRRFVGPDEAAATQSGNLVEKRAKAVTPRGQRLLHGPERAWTAEPAERIGQCNRKPT